MKTINESLCLFKYCKWDKYTKENLIKKQIYPQKAINENDPFESRPVFNKKQWINRMISEKGYEVSSAIIKKKFDEYIDYYLQLIRSNTYIVSLCERNDDILMWSHYANNHKGVCIEYDVSNYIPPNPPYSPISPVIYSNKRVEWPSIIFNNDPLIMANDNYIMGRVMSAINTKAKQWSYEKEWRLVSMYSGEFSFLLVHPRRICSVCIGNEVSDLQTRRIYNFIKKIDSSIRVYKMCISRKFFKLVKKEIKE